ncbi:uncharacterized protein DS421_17g580870 [Arachis hypogaea]|nr:uncharacterized protein DS421_17g580870 [Arachis hypogaea]
MRWRRDVVVVAAVFKPVAAVAAGRGGCGTQWLPDAVAVGCSIGGGGFYGSQRREER